MTITESLLTLTEPLIVKLIDKQKQLAIENNEQLSSYDEKMIRLQLTYKLLSSIVTYTKSTDRLGNFIINCQQNQFVINAVILRNSEIYNLSTEIIIAGGYNIQCAHYRYITKTNLKNEKDLSSIKCIYDKIKKLSKIEKLQQEIDGYNKQIEDSKQRITESEILTEEEILQKDEHWLESSKLTWSTIVERGADKNYDYDESKFNQSRKEYRQSKLDFFKSMNITSQYLRIKSLEKSIKRVQSKIDKIQ